MNQTRNIIIGIVAILVVALLAFLVSQERQATVSPGATATSTNSTTTPITINLASTTSTTTVGGYTIAPVTIQNGPAAPNFKTPLTFSATISADEKAQDQSQFQAVQAALTGNKTDFNAWLELGILRESTGDYKGAAAAWKYLTQIYPKDPTAYANLGNLYANDLHQSAQGIAYYKQAIKADPTKEETLYDNLAQIYLGEGDKADAKATLQQGIDAKVIGYQNLQNELNSIQ